MLALGKRTGNRVAALAEEGANYRRMGQPSVKQGNCWCKRNSERLKRATVSASGRTVCKEGQRLAQAAQCLQRVRGCMRKYVHNLKKHSLTKPLVLSLLLLIPKSTLSALWEYPPLEHFLQYSVFLLPCLFLFLQPCLF